MASLDDIKVDLNTRGIYLRLPEWPEGAFVELGIQIAKRPASLREIFNHYLNLSGEAKHLYSNMALDMPIFVDGKVTEFRQVMNVRNTPFWYRDDIEVFEEVERDDDRERAMAEVADLFDPSLYRSFTTGTWYLTLSYSLKDERYVAMVREELLALVPLHLLTWATNAGWDYTHGPCAINMDGAMVLKVMDGFAKAMWSCVPYWFPVRISAERLYENDRQVLVLYDEWLYCLLMEDEATVRDLRDYSEPTWKDLELAVDEVEPCNAHDSVDWSKVFKGWRR